MVDDEFQLPVLTARYLADSAIAADRKRAFLLDTADAGEPRLGLLLREMALVSATTGPYALDPVATNLVSFESATRRTGARRVGATATPAMPTGALPWT